MNDGASIKMKLELFLRLSSCEEKFDNFQHSRERVAANDLNDAETHLNPPSAVHNPTFSLNAFFDLPH